MTLRILVVTQYFYPENFRINSIVKGLILQGHSVSVLTGCPNYPDGFPFDGYSSLQLDCEMHPDGYPIHRVPIITRGQDSPIKLFLNYLSFIVSGIVFGTYALKNTKFNIVFVYAPSPIFQSLVGVYFKWLKGAPLITWVQDLWPECLESTGHFKNKQILDIIAKLVSWTYQRNDLLLTQSKSFIPSVKMRAGSTPVEYFPNPGDENSNLDFVSDSISPADKYFLKYGFNIVFAGNLGTVQSLPMILDAAEILRDELDVRIIFFGSGSLFPWLKSEIQSRQLMNVVLAGRYSADEMPAIYSRASTLLVSLNNDPVLNQTIPAKLQSYLAAGRPIIASLDGEGAQIVVDAKAGFSCPTEDPSALARTILKLKNMSQVQLDSMGASGKRYFAQNFELTSQVRQLIKIFAETISNASNTRDHEK